MTQDALYGTIVPTNTDGQQLAALLNSWRAAVVTGHSGQTRPSYAKAGMVWLKTPAAGGMEVTLFDGTKDVMLMKVQGGVPSLNPLISAVPVGGVIDFYGTTVPSGWAACDGATVQRSDGSGTIKTPDLRSRFILSADSRSGSVRTVGQTGGVAEGTDINSGYAGDHTHTTGSAGTHDHNGNTGSVALSVSQMPAHTHLVVGEDSSAADASPNTTTAVADRTDRYSSQNYVLNRSSEPYAAAGRSSITGGGSSHNHSIGNDGAHTHSVGTAGNHRHTVDCPYPQFYVLMKIMKV